jgi:hypothetical protein
VALSDNEDLQLHFTPADVGGETLVEVAQGAGWTTDGTCWHCERCPALTDPVCEPCRAGDHALCEDPECACAAQAPSPGQGTLPFGEAPHG